MYALAEWPRSTSTTTTTFDEAAGLAGKRLDFSKCCVSKISNDPQYGTYCLSFGTATGCFDEQKIQLERRKRWLQISDEWNKDQLQDYFDEFEEGSTTKRRAEMKIENLLECNSARCNPLPATRYSDENGIMLLDCPLNKEPDEISEMFAAKSKVNSSKGYAWCAVRRMRALQEECFNKTLKFLPEYLLYLSNLSQENGLFFPEIFPQNPAAHLDKEFLA